MRICRPRGRSLVGDRVKFRVGRIVFLAFSPDDTRMGFGFRRTTREALEAVGPTPGLRERMLALLWLDPKATGVLLPPWRTLRTGQVGVGGRMSRSVRTRHDDCGPMSVALAVVLALLANGIVAATGASASAPAVVPQLSRDDGAGPQFCGSVVPGTTTNLGPAFDNVYPCGPLPPAHGTAGYGDDFEASPWGFQCTELADRFLWVVYGDKPVLRY